MAAGAIGIVGKYIDAGIEERIQIILENYPNFMEILDGYEESLKFLIINERRATRRKAMGDLGIKVMASGISDKTSSEAIDRVMLSEAFKSGNIDDELKDVECPEEFRKEALTIKDMRDDYYLLKSQIKTLPWNDYKILDTYLNGEHDLLKIADHYNLTYDGARGRLRRCRNKIRKSTAAYLKKKYSFR